MINESPIVKRLFDLIQERGVTPKKVTEDTGISSSSFTDWKNGKASPGVEALSKLAPYFGVSLDYLITGKESSAPSRKEAREHAFLDKLRLLPSDCRERIGTYMDGKVDIELTPVSVVNFDTSVRGDTRQVLLPKLSHKVNSVMQIKVAYAREQKLLYNQYKIQRVETAMTMYLRECENSGSEEAMRRYRVVKMRYMDEKERTVAEIAAKEKVSDKSIYNDIRVASRAIGDYLVAI